MNENIPSVMRRRHLTLSSSMMMKMMIQSLWMAVLLLSAAPQVVAATSAIGDVCLSSSLSSRHSSLFTPACSFYGSSLSDGNHGFRSFWSDKKKSSSLLESASAAAATSASVLSVTTTSTNIKAVDMMSSAFFRFRSRSEEAQLRRISSSYLARQKQRLVQSLQQQQQQQPQIQLYKPKTTFEQQQSNIVSTGTVAAAMKTTQRKKQQQRQQPESADMSARGGGGGAGASTASAAMALVFWENMVCGATSRSIAQTIMHPANCLKTLLQTSSSRVAVSSSSASAAAAAAAAAATVRTMTVASLLKQPAASLQRLTQGAGASLLLSLPTGAVNFAVLEYVRQGLGDLVASSPYLSSQMNGNSQHQKQKIGPLLDFASSAISTIVCSIVATPQTMVCDNIMAGNYPNLPSAVSGLARRGGIRAFYQGWVPGLVGKIPAYALTWTLFQRFKDIRQQWTPINQHYRPATNFENSVMACLASSASVCIMIPMDCIKTRLVTQAAGDAAAYQGILDCAIRVAREEGIGAFYRGLPPRLISVVPMMAIQFAVYEAMKRSMLQRKSLQQQQLY